MDRQQRIDRTFAFNEEMNDPQRTAKNDAAIDRNTFERQAGLQRELHGTYEQGLEENQRKFNRERVLGWDREKGSMDQAAAREHAANWRWLTPQEQYRDVPIRKDPDTGEITYQTRLGGRVVDNEGSQQGGKFDWMKKMQFDPSNAEHLGLLNDEFGRMGDNPADQDAFLGSLRDTNPKALMALQKMRKSREAAKQPGGRTMNWQSSMPDVGADVLGGMTYPAERTFAPMRPGLITGDRARMVEAAGAADLNQSQPGLAEVAGAASVNPGQGGYMGMGAYDKRRFPARVLGGPVQPNRPYLVGEQGPEVVVPQQAGTVIPNSATPQPIMIAQQNQPGFFDRMGGMMNPANRPGMPGGNVPAPNPQPAAQPSATPASAPLPTTKPAGMSDEHWQLLLKYGNG